MAASLLQTKLYVPSPGPRLVHRTRLIDQLDEGLRRKMTLVSAPAGFGKTTLVGEWVGHLRSGAACTDHVENRIAWLSLDETDNDPARFLTYLIAALQAMEPPPESVGTLGADVLSALQSPQPPDERILVSLINEIAAIPGRVVLVLDDYHLIDAQPVHDALIFLLRHLPPPPGPGRRCQGMHLVVATRDDPLLPLARLRAQGQLIELRAADLRFTSSEAAEFLNQAMGLDLSAADVAALENRTEGWIAGLQLAAISMQGHEDVSGFIESFTGSHHFVLDYLAEEVLHRQPEHIQAFLLQTAILDRLTGSLCDAVRFGLPRSAGDPEETAEDSRATLEMLERANLFVVPLDDERRWYRYHQLFADLLRQRLHQTQLEQVPTLHARASEWYERHGFAAEAIEHALRAEDVERAAYLIEQHFDAMYQSGEHVKLRRWLAGLPDELVFSRPQLAILHAWGFFSSGQLDAAERSLQAAEGALDPMICRADLSSPVGSGRSPGIERAGLRGRIAAMRAYLASYRGDLSGTIEYARRALECLPRHDYTWRSTAAIALGDAYSVRGELAAAYQARRETLATSKASGDLYLSLMAHLRMAATLRQQGQLRRITTICHQQLQLLQESGLSQTVAAGWLLAICGETMAELGDLDLALDRATSGVELTERGRDVAMIGWSNLCLIRVLFSRGELPDAERIVRKMERFSRQHDVPPWIANHVAAWRARLWLAQDKLDAASLWAEERGLAPDRDPTYLHEAEYLVLARILIACGRLDEATELLQRLFARAERGGHTSGAIEVLILQALSLQAGGDTDGAVAMLEQALSFAEPGGHIRIFVDEGPPMARLLHRAAARGMAPDYTHRLLAAFPAARPEQTTTLKSSATQSELVEPLSERELEVLELIAEGLTNQEIASRLYLSLNTVKAHTRNTYGKLAVHSRTHATAKARALGLLPSE